MEKYTTKELEDLVDKEFEGLKSKSNDEKKSKNEDVKKLIVYYNGLTNNIEERRSKILTYALQVFLLVITGIGILIKIKVGIGEYFWPGLAVLIANLIFAVLIIVWYFFQSGFRYPFLKLDNFGNKWKWFYYGNEFISNINRNAIFPSKKPEKTSKPYLEGLLTFVTNYSQEDIDEELKNNLQQLYLLQVHNYFKNKFYLVLVEFQKWSAYISFGIIVLYGLIKLTLLLFCR